VSPQWPCEILRATKLGASVGTRVDAPFFSLAVFFLFIRGLAAGFIGFAICVLLKEAPAFYYSRFLVFIAPYNSA
jgi:hypothetical protein